jgi:hypothetical protein
MHLARWNSLVEAAEWLTHATKKQWTWKAILSRLEDMHVETLHVVIPPGTRLLLNVGGEWHEVSYDVVIVPQVCGINGFLHQIQLGLDEKSEWTKPLGLVLADKRLRATTAFSASSIRLTKSEVLNVGNLPSPECQHGFESLVDAMSRGEYSSLATVCAKNKDASSVLNNAVVRVPALALPKGVTSAEIITKFKLSSVWVSKLSHIDRNPFLEKSGALMQRGHRQSGKTPRTPSLWNPVKFAEMLIQREKKTQKQMAMIIEHRFAKWLDVWDVAQSVDESTDWDESIEPT